MNKAEITLIVPVYNVEKYIDVMLKSVFSQSFKDYNLVLINDGSTDKSEEIIQRYMNKYENIIYIKQENKGVSEARNVGMSRINSKYTLFLDPDDFIDKYMLEKMHKKAEDNNADIVICDFDNIYEEFRNDKVNLEVDEDKIYTNIDIMKLMLEFKVEGQLWNKLFLSDLIKKANVKFEKGRIIEDLFPVFKMISKSNKIVFINEQLYYYRQRPSSLLGINKNMKVMEDQNFAYKSIVNLVKENKIDVEAKLLYFVAYVQSSHINKCVQNSIKCTKEIYKKFEVNNYTLQELIKSKANIREKLKILLFKMNIIHVFYKAYFLCQKVSEKPENTNNCNKVKI